MPLPIERSAAKAEARPVQQRTGAGLSKKRAWGSTLVGKPVSNPNPAPQRYAPATKSKGSPKTTNAAPVPRRGVSCFAVSFGQTTAV